MEIYIPSNIVLLICMVTVETPYQQNYQSQISEN